MAIYHREGMKITINHEGEDERWIHILFRTMTS
jgi:hypothetical protein